MKILAAIVTHNRLELLKRCLKSLEHQTRKPDEVLIINNESSDGTYEYIEQTNFTSIHQKNNGSAGGWYSAIKYALKKDFSHIWLMDDDGFPDSQALMELCSHSSPEIVCLSSVVVKESNTSELVFPFPRLNNKLLPTVFNFPSKIRSVDHLRMVSKNNLYDFAHLFNGSLISIEAIRKIGLINTSYYIYGDELDYLYRLKAKGRLCTLNTAIHYHPDVSKRPLNYQKLYFYIKNSLIINNSYLNLSIIRNAFVLPLALLRFSLRNSLLESLNLLLGAKSNLVYKALYRGYRAKLGNDFEQ